MQKFYKTIDDYKIVLMVLNVEPFIMHKYLQKLFENKYFSNGSPKRMAHARFTIVKFLNIGIRYFTTELFF